MARTLKTADLQRLLRVYILIVAMLTLHMIYKDQWRGPSYSYSDIHPYTMIPEPIIGKPCKYADKEKMPNSPLSHANQENKPSRILYLVQTEECLPGHLRSALGNSSSCECDVVVLSYVSNCNDTSLAHVKYLFNSSTTWTSGRNLLYYTNIYKRGEPYLYYILMDDDIVIYWRERWSKMYENKNPWRAFERFIRKVQPAVAAVEVSDMFLRHTEELHVARNCCMDPEYTVTVRYDAAFNAFHYQAVEHVLPYWEHYDNVSWFYSQLHLIAWSEVVFRGQVLVHRKLIGLNPQHRPYPRLGKFDVVLPTILENIRERLPLECRNASLLEQCEKMGFDHLRTESSTYCLPPPPPNQTITPFRNFVC